MFLLFGFISLLNANSYGLDTRMYQCTSCCRVQFLSMFNPLNQKTHEYDYSNPDEIYWVMDFQFDEQTTVREKESKYELEFRVRPLFVSEEKSFTRQSFELRPYQMISMFHNNKYVMDFCSGVKKNTPLIPWGKKDEKDPDTNNQRFLYIYDNPGYTGRGYKYRKAFYVPYKTLDKKDVCFTVGSSYNDAKPCEISHSGDGYNNCVPDNVAKKIDETYYELKGDYSYDDWGFEITAQYCYGQDGVSGNYFLYKRQTWLPIYW